MDRNWQELKGSRAAGTHSNMVRTDIFKIDPLAHLILGKNYQWKSNLGLTFPHVKFTQNLLNSYKTGQKLTRSFSVFYSTKTSTTTQNKMCCKYKSAIIAKQVFPLFLLQMTTHYVTQLDLNYLEIPAP